MDPLFLENTSTVLPRLNVSLSHLHLKTKKMHKHSTSLYLRTDFCNLFLGRRGVSHYCTTLHGPDFTLKT